MEFALIWGVGGAIICAILAGRKNRNQVLWALLGFLFGLIAIVILAVLPTVGGRTASSRGPRPAQPYAPRRAQPYTPPARAVRAEEPFAITAQGLDRNFTPNGSPEWIQLGSMTGREFAGRAAEMAPPDPGGSVPNVAFDRDGVRLVLYQEDATVWHATAPPPGMTDRVAVHQIAEWLEAGIAYARRA